MFRAKRQLEPSSSSSEPSSSSSDSSSSSSSSSSGSEEFSSGSYDGSDFFELGSSSSMVEAINLSYESQPDQLTKPQRREEKRKFTENEQQRKTIDDLCEGIKKGDSFIYLENCIVSHQAVEQISAAIAENPKQITTLELRNIELDDADMLVLIDALQTQISITRLHLGKNLFTDHCMQALVDKVLMKQVDLQYLNLSENTIGNDGARALTKLIAQHKTLRSLYLNAIDTSASGIVAVIKALQNNDHLELLNLSDNDLATHGLESIKLPLLQMQCVISSLYLNNTQLSKDAFRSLTEALAQQCHIKHLYIANNHIDENDIDVLIRALEVNQQLQFLDISNNELRPSATTKVIDHMHQRMQQYKTDQEQSKIPTYVPIVRIILQRETDNEKQNQLLAKDHARLDELWYKYQNVQHLIIDNNVKPKSSGQTYLFYDLETSGRNPCFDQIVQFAAIKTDEKFRQIAQYNFYVQLNPDVIPNIIAFYTHQIPLDKLADGLVENEAALKIYRLFGETDIQVGYNNITFDHKFLRFCFHRNFLPVYEFQQSALKISKEKDLYAIASIYYLIKDSSNTNLQCKNVTWPADGSLRLEALMQANNFVYEEKAAHDALVDIQETVNLARLLSGNQLLFQYLLEQFDQNTLIQTIHHTLTRAIIVKYNQAIPVYLLEYFPNGNHHRKISKQESHWLRLDEIDLESCLEKQATLTHKLIIKRKKFDACMVFSEVMENTLGVEIYNELQQQINNAALVEKNLDLLRNPDVLVQLRALVLASQKSYSQQIPDIDADLYADTRYSTSFYRFKEVFQTNVHPSLDVFRRDMNLYLQSTDIHERINWIRKVMFHLSNQRFEEKCFRLLGRNYLKYLDTDEQARFRQYLQNRIDNPELVDYKGEISLTVQQTIEQYKSITSLLGSKLSRGEKTYLRSIYNYVCENFLKINANEAKRVLVHDIPEAKKQKMTQRQAQTDKKGDQEAPKHVQLVTTVGVFQEPKRHKMQNIISAPHNALQGLNFQKIPADGKCLFHAIGLYLGQDADSLRKSTADYMEENFEKFKNYREGDDEEFRQHIEAIRNADEWGDHLEIEILQRITLSPIIIIRPNTNPTIPDNLEELTCDPIFIYYNGVDHYDAFILKEDAQGTNVLTAIQAAIEQNELVAYVHPESISQRVTRL